MIVVDIAPTISASIGEIPLYTRILLDNLHRIQHEKDIVAARRAMNKILEASTETLRQVRYKFPRRKSNKSFLFS